VVRGCIFPDRAGFLWQAAAAIEPDIGPFVLEGSSVTVVAARSQPVLAAPAASATGGLTEKLILESRGHGPVEKTTKVQNIEGPGPGTSAVQVTIPEGTEGKSIASMPRQ